MPIPEITACDVTFRNNNLEVYPPLYDPGDTVQVQIEFTSDGAETEVDNLSLKIVDTTDTVTDLSTSVVATVVDGVYSFDYYLSTGTDGDDALVPPGTYWLNVEGANNDGTNVSTTVFFIVNANAAVSPEADMAGGSLAARTMVEVGRILRSRTKNAAGRTIGRFTPDTVPNELEVREQVTISHNYVSMYTGYDFSDTSIFTDEILSIIVSVTALKTACLIELGYFPEQVRTDKSAYKEYNEMFKDLLEQLVDALGDMASGGVIGGASDTGEAQYGFPEDDGGLVGWQTPW